MLEARKVLYCDVCGMPPEYCEYVADFETLCIPWLQKTHPGLFEKLYLSTDEATTQSQGEEESSTPAPTGPWTIEERLHAFYAKYMPEKLDNIPSLLQKYEGREEQLFTALVKKYGDEPEDPYIAAKYGASDDEDVADALSSKLSVVDKKKQRGIATSKKAAPKDDDGDSTRILIQKESRSRRKFVTIVHGMETIPSVKLKDAAKKFSKRFAGSASVKDSQNGKQKEIIIQGDHMDEVASFIVKNFKVNAEAVFLDIDGEFVPIV